jgi:hypothetical protein
MFSFPRVLRNMATVSRFPAGHFEQGQARQGLARLVPEERASPPRNPFFRHVCDVNFQYPKMRRMLLFLTVPLCALAQDQGVQRELIQRDAQSDAFALQLRQSQERLALPQGDLRRQQELEARQFGERFRLDAATETQLRDVSSDLPAALRPYERRKAEEHRRTLTAPGAP